MYLQRIIEQKRKLLAKGLSSEDLIIKANRPCARWITVHEEKINWSADNPTLLGVSVVVDDNVKNDFTITLKDRRAVKK